MDSLERRVFVLADETWVHPGHGDDTTLGQERPSIPEWRERGW
jgi:glyoxylase-like metal-dependent hydrolase (beta-lactamase superfamily II)